MGPSREAFDASYARLNDEQRAGVEAIWHPPGPIVALPAGAGAGKTASLVVALAGLHYYGICSGQDVIAVTFTRVGEAEMQERLNKLVPPGTFPRVLTYDKLVWRWLARGGGRSALAAKARTPSYSFLGPIASQEPRFFGENGVPATDTLMKLIVCQDKRADIPGLPGFRGFNWYDRWTEDVETLGIIRSFHACREWVRAYGLFFEVPETQEAAYTQGIRAWHKRYDGIAGLDPDQYVMAIQKFEEAKRRIGAVERLDPMFWYKAIARDPVKRFLVDEAQDNTRLQVEIARDKAEQGGGTYVLIGDVKQSIFGFRAAAPEVMASVIQDPAATVRPLRANYRSLPRIVRAGALVAEGHDWNLGGEPVPMRMDNPERPGLLRAQCYGSDALFSGIAAEVAKRTQAGESPSNFAILCRSNAACDAVQAALDEHGVPAVRLGNRGGPWDQIPARAALTWAAVCSNEVAGLPKPAEWLPLFLTFPKREMIGAQTATEFAGAVLRSRSGSAAEALEQILNGVRFGKQRDALVALASDLQRCSAAFRTGWDAGILALADTFDVPHSMLSELPASELEATDAVGLSETALREMKATEEATKRDADDEDGDAPDTEEREAVDRAVRAAGVALRAMRRAGNFTASVQAQILGSQTPCFPDQIDPADRVRLEAALSSRTAVSTIHGAKGKEWHTVFVLADDRSFDRGRIEAAPSSEQPPGWHELQRLLYVAVTRARDELALVWPLSQLPSHTVQRQLLPYFAEMRERSWEAARLREALRARPEWSIEADGLEVGEDVSLTLRGKQTDWFLVATDVGVTEFSPTEGLQDAWTLRFPDVDRSDAAIIRSLHAYVGSLDGGKPAWLPPLNRATDAALETLAAQGMPAAPRVPLRGALASVLRERQGADGSLPLTWAEMQQVVCGGVAAQSEVVEPRDADVEPPQPPSVIEVDPLPGDPLDLSAPQTFESAAEPLVVEESGPAKSITLYVEQLVTFQGPLELLLPASPWPNVELSELPWAIQIGVAPGASSGAVLMRLASHSDPASARPATQQFCVGTLLLFHAVTQPAASTRIYTGILRVVALPNKQAGMEWVSHHVTDLAGTDAPREELGELLRHANMVGPEDHPTTVAGYALAVLTGAFDLCLQVNARAFLSSTGEVKQVAPPTLDAFLRDHAEDIKTIALTEDIYGAVAAGGVFMAYRAGAKRSRIEPRVGREV